MRATLPLTLLLTTGAMMACAPVIAEPDLKHEGTIHESTDGVALHDGQRGGNAGMLGTTCEFSQNGFLGVDANVNGRGSPRVLDSDRDGYGGDVVLVKTRDQLGLIEGGWHVASADVPGVTDAVLTRDGIVALGNCALSWLGGAAGFDRTVRLEGATCGDAVMAVDRDSSTAFVTAGNEVVRIGRDGNAGLGFRADGVLWSPTLDAVVLTHASSGLVQAVTPTGELLWSTDLDLDGRGIVAHSAVDLGAIGRIAVATRGAERNLVMIDAFTGEIVNASPIGHGAELVASPDGASMAIVRSTRVELFSVK